MSRLLRLFLVLLSLAAPITAFASSSIPISLALDPASTPTAGGALYYDAGFTLPESTKFVNMVQTISWPAGLPADFIQYHPNDPILVVVGNTTDLQPQPFSSVFPGGSLTLQQVNANTIQLAATFEPSGVKMPAGSYTFIIGTGVGTGLPTDPCNVASFLRLYQGDDPVTPVQSASVTVQ